MTHSANRTTTDETLSRARLSRSERIRMVLDLLRDAEDRPDLRKLEAELSQLSGLTPETKPIPHQATAKTENDIPPVAAVQSKAPSDSLAFLQNEHPALLAQQLLGQAEAQRRAVLQTCSGPLARQVRFLLAQ